MIDKNESLEVRSSNASIEKITKIKIFLDCKIYLPGLKLSFIYNTNNGTTSTTNYKNFKENL